MALHQLWLAERSALTPWSGGGFGMFSTTDAWGTRHLHASALGLAFRTTLAVPPALDDELRRTLALPTEARLLELARTLAAHTVFDLEAPETIRVDVWARRHDAETLAPYGELLRSVELPLDGARAAP